MYSIRYLGVVKFVKLYLVVDSYILVIVIKDVLNVVIKYVYRFMLVSNMKKRGGGCALCAIPYAVYITTNGFLVTTVFTNYKFIEFSCFQNVNFISITVF